MNELRIRLPRRVGERLLSEIRRNCGREAVVFGLVTHAPDHDLILVPEIRVPPEHAYLPPSGHGARWSGKYSIEILNEAAARRCGVFIFHFHPGTAVRMSLDDVSSAKQLLPKFQLVIPERPHGSIVLGDDSLAGMILMPNTDGFGQRMSLRRFLPQLSDTPWLTASPQERRAFQRQPLARGRLLEATFQKTQIAVVGQSGGGSHVTLQLAQHGIGRIWGIDDDYADKGNRSSGLGFSKRDVRRRKQKIAVLREQIKRLDPNIQYIPVSARVPEQLALDALKRADIIIGCVNNLHARADLQEIALRYCIPYVDLGLILTTRQEAGEEFPSIAAISGNIFSYVPGEACMWCTGFLTKEKLAQETQRRGRPYLTTSSGADAQVLSFNGVLASQAVSDILQLLTGFADGANHISYRKYDGFTGTMLPCEVRARANCEHCSKYLAAGDSIWRNPRAVLQAS